MAIVRRTPPPAVPVALMAKHRFGDLIVIRVPEERIAWFSHQGWLLLAQDSDHPITLPEGHIFDPCMAGPCPPQQRVDSTNTDSTNTTDGDSA